MARARTAYPCAPPPPLRPSAAGHLHYKTKRDVRALGPYKDEIPSLALERGPAE
jgi:hypothetical protein